MIHLDYGVHHIPSDSGGQRHTLRECALIVHSLHTRSQMECKGTQFKSSDTGSHLFAALNTLCMPADSKEKLMSRD